MRTIAELFEQALDHLQSGRLGLAEKVFRQILQTEPHHGEAWHFLGLIAGQLGRHDLAVEYLGQALHLKPGYVEAHNNLGIVLREQGNLEEAEASYREALRLKPDFAEAHESLAVVLQDQGRLEEAEAGYRKAIHLKPGFAGAHRNLGLVLQDQGRLEEAEASFREALRLKPDYAAAHLSLSYHWLRLGNFALGWPEYEWGRQIKDNLRLGPLSPKWEGTALDGQTILLQAEQGIGDIFQFVRYARQVKKKGGRVLLQCPPALVAILSGCPGIDQLVPAGTTLPCYQVTAPLLSLPLLFGTTLETIPAEVPYLTADPARVAHWRSRLGAISGLKVGICWQGNPTFKDDRKRSVPLAFFAPLAAVPGVCLIALQRGPGLEQIVQNKEHLKIVDLPGRSEDPAQGWLDTAALIEALDLVISIDTGVVHLAGALAAPVWVALPFMPDWRWLLNRADSPWYPKMRLFRQQKPGVWPEVFQHIAEELGQWVATRESKNSLESPP